MEQTCRQCSAAFQITDEDLAFYEKVSPVFQGKKELIPPPTHCPPCRHQRRLSHRNERHLFHRKCDKTGKQIISQYSDPSVTVYDNAEWWSDSWNPLDYGRDVDFNRPFFEQFAELQKQVPHLSLINDSSNENSDYANQTAFLKDCYLVFSSDYGEKSYYMHGSGHFTSCMDCYNALHCELCYECINCVRCYNVAFSQGCDGCSDSYFLRDCKGCRNCFGCNGLRNKEYCMFNEQLDRETYEHRLKEFGISGHEALSHVRQQIREWMLTQPTKALFNVNAEDSSGDFLTNTQRAIMCFDCFGIRDCTYCTTIADDVSDCMDYDVAGIGTQLTYESITIGYNASNILFCTDCWSGIHNLLYCDACIQSHDLFGCVGIRNGKYCILNKQYSKEAYERLVLRIIAHMRETGEWGEFFPSRNSLFGYNETVAQDFFPLEKKDVLMRGWTWHDEPESGQQYLGPDAGLPDTIEETPDTVMQRILRCEVTKKPYKIIPQELRLYREWKLPIPRRSPEQRHMDRVRQCNHRTLWKRPCAKCANTIETTYAPDRPEIVYCEECYLQTVY